MVPTDLTIALAAVVSIEAYMFVVAVAEKCVFAIDLATVATVLVAIVTELLFLLT